MMDYSIVLLYLNYNDKVVKNILLTPHSSFIVSSLSIAPVKGELMAILELHNWYYLGVGDP